MSNQVYKLSAFGVILAGFLIYLVYQFGTEKAITPCSPGGLPSRCYQITEKMCDSVWAKSEISCNSFVKKFSLPPGRLIGPVMFKCQSAFLDNIFLGSRKSTSECNQMFDDLKGWENRNDYK